MRRMHTPIGLVALITVLANGISVAQPSRESATDELRLLAEQGDLQAQLALGMRYRDGKGVPRDYREALRWYRRCADEGDGAGLDNVGFMYLSGWGVPVDFTIAAAYFKAAGSKNDAQGLFNLGNCYFSGQGVEQDYSLAIDCWRRAAASENANAIWRMATLQAAGESMPRDLDHARVLCQSIADKGDLRGMILLGELYARQGAEEVARHWWEQATGRGNAQAEALLRLSKWRHQAPAPGAVAYVEVDHLYQGWNNCGATSLAMYLRHAGVDATPYDVKRLCPQSPIGTGTDWADLLAAGEKLGQHLEVLTFPNNHAGFTRGVEVIRNHLDADRPVVIDFTVTRERDGEIERSGHTLLVVGYNAELDQFVLKNPNQPPPGIQLMSAEELERNWFSRGYSRAAEGRDARPLIVGKKP